MKYLFLDAYYHPENVAYTHLEDDLIEKLVENGHRVEIIVSTPSRGLSKEEIAKYKKVRFESLRDGNVLVHRFWAPNENRNLILRAIRYLWCNIATFNMARKRKDIDAVFCASTPPTQGMLAAIIAKRLSKKYKRHIPVVFNLQDMFPESLLSAKIASKGSLIYKIGEKISNYTYKNADKIVAISKSMKARLIEKGVDEGKIEIISNWTDTDKVSPVEKEKNFLFSEFNIPADKFIVLYAGNFGESQGTSVIVKASELLLNNEKILFVLFGAGSEFQSTKNLINEKKIGNVMVFDLLPQDRINEVYSLGDISLITCQKGAGESAFPSKTWNIMACNTPIIASFDTNSNLADVLNDSRAGICVEPENEYELARAIENAQINGTDNTNAREYVLANASKKMCTQRYMEIFDEVVGR